MAQQLIILSHTSLSVESYTDNGVHKNLHYIVKNNPFFLEVALSGNVSSKANEKLNFHQLRLEANLHYDIPDSPEVSKLKIKPFEYKGVVNESDPKKCTLEVSIAVLSSQHEEMNFKLHLRAVNNATGSYIPGLEVWSEPIQVISKPEVLRKKQEPKKKKRTWNDRVTELLERIESQQQEHFNFLKKVSANSGGSLPATAVSAAPVTSSANNNKTPFERMESAYHEFLAAFSELDEDDRPLKVRKLLNRSSPSEIQSLSEFSSYAVPSSASNKGDLDLTSPGTVSLDSAGGIYPAHLNFDDLLLQQDSFMIDGSASSADRQEIDALLQQFLS